MIVSKLAERGHEAVAASTVPQAFDVLRSDNCSFAITTRPDIDLLRSIRPVPVVNLEIFFHAEPSGDGLLVASKRLDGSALMERIAFLSTTKRTDPAGAVRAKDEDQGERGAARWWTAAKVRLGLPRQRKGLKDVRSSEASGTPGDYSHSKTDRGF
ncbi:hypothetical protein SAMCCGM7_pC0698 (plasmid) [Sinorhizobium americanum CCGM7]|nr:hypothetical protein SAMCCGM7_pC0698 [Sinorhizobium americanum CCGM7]